jgi:hypothetical protein
MLIVECSPNEVKARRLIGLQHPPCGGLFSARFAPVSRDIPTEWPKSRCVISSFHEHFGRWATTFNWDVSWSEHQVSGKSRPQQSIIPWRSTFAMLRIHLGCVAKQWASLYYPYCMRASGYSTVRTFLEACYHQTLTRLYTVLTKQHLTPEGHLVAANMTQLWCDIGEYVVESVMWIQVKDLGDWSSKHTLHCKDMKYWTAEGKQPSVPTRWSTTISARI